MQEALIVECTISVIHRPKGGQTLEFYCQYIASLLLQLTSSVMKCDISVR